MKNSILCLSANMEANDWFFHENPLVKLWLMKGGKMELVNQLLAARNYKRKDLDAKKCFRCVNSFSYPTNTYCWTQYLLIYQYPGQKKTNNSWTGHINTKLIVRSHAKNFFERWNRSDQGCGVGIGVSIKGNDSDTGRYINIVNALFFIWNLVFH